MSVVKNIAIVAPGFEPVPAVRGGAVETLITMLINLNEKGHRYNIDLYTVDDPALLEVNFKHTRVIAVKRYGVQKLVCRAINYLFRKARINIVILDFTKSFTHEVCKKRYDKIIVENNMVAYKKLHRKYSKVYPGTNFYFHAHNDLGSPGKTISNAKFISKTAKKMIFVSQALRKSFEDKIGKVDGTVLYNTIDFGVYDEELIKKRAEYRKTMRMSLGEYNYLYVGRICEGKGILEMLEAFSAIAGRHDDVTLTIVGFRSTQGESPFERKVLRKISRMNGKVRMQPYCHSNIVREYMIAADVIVVPSTCYEAFGVVALEAMAMQKAIISTNAGGLTEPLDTICAVIVDKGHLAKELPDAMEKVYSDRGFASSLSHEAFRKVHSTAAFDARNYLMLFSEAIEEGV